MEHCPENQFDCFGTGKKCIDYVKTCDSMNDCGGWEDESRSLCESKCFFLEFWLSFDVYSVISYAINLSKISALFLY